MNPGEQTRQDIADAINAYGPDVAGEPLPIVATVENLGFWSEGLAAGALRLANADNWTRVS